MTVEATQIRNDGAVGDGVSASAIHPRDLVHSYVADDAQGIRQPGHRYSVKLIAERAIALVILVPMLPFLVLVAALIRLETKGAPLFVQWRHGRQGQPFQILKFRTMHTDSCDITGAQQTMDRDPRITKVGRFLRRTSIDELPQLINVLRGEMALIGPRAHPCGMLVEGKPCEVHVPNYHMRHGMCPGITGWAQVNGSRGALKTKAMLQHRVALDIEYIEHWSFALDLKILLRTFPIVVTCPG